MNSVIGHRTFAYVIFELRNEHPHNLVSVYVSHYPDTIIHKELKQAQLKLDSAGEQTR